jgi:hypothetical protein
MHGTRSCARNARGADRSALRRPRARVLGFQRGAIAAALAKAQAELIDPEKSLVGITGPSSLREPERAFRYAALANGLAGC